MTNFYQKWRKLQVFGRKLKNHVSKQFETAVSSTNVVFGQINPLGGFTNVNAGIFHILSFWPIFGPEKWKKMAKNAKFWTFWGQNG